MGVTHLLGPNKPSTGADLLEQRAGGNLTTTFAVEGQCPRGRWLHWLMLMNLQVSEPPRSPPGGKWVGVFLPLPP